MSCRGTSPTSGTRLSRKALLSQPSVQIEYGSLPFASCDVRVALWACNALKSLTLSIDCLESGRIAGCLKLLLWMDKNPFRTT